MLVIGIILMLIGVIATFTGVRLQKKNPNMQFISIIGILILLGGLGLYAAPQLSGEADMETPMIFAASQTHAVGEYLKENYGGKKLYLAVEASMKNHAFTQAKAKALSDAYGSQAEIIAPDVSNDVNIMGLTAKQFNELFDQYPDGIIVCDISCNGDNRLLNGISAFKKSQIFMMQFNPAKAMYNMIKKGQVLGCITGKGGSYDENFEPDADNLKEAFDARYVIIKPDNVDEFKNNFFLK